MIIGVSRLLVYAAQALASVSEMHAFLFELEKRIYAGSTPYNDHPGIISHGNLGEIPPTNSCTPKIGPHFW
jgi:hypothetical protein